MVEDAGGGTRAGARAMCQKLGAKIMDQQHVWGLGLG